MSFFTLCYTLKSSTKLENLPKFASLAKKQNLKNFFFTSWYGVACV